jgi:ribonucleoside-triphosphate reductase
MKVSQIQKRDSTIVPFDSEKIRNAIHKAVAATGTPDEEKEFEITGRVIKTL